METTGCGTAIVTPFKADGSLDEAALWALVNWQIDSGIDFLVACGSTGEAATLDEDEWLHDRSAWWSMRRRGGCRFGPDARTTPRARCCARPRCCAQVRGVSAVLSANPYYNKPYAGGAVPAFSGAGQGGGSAAGGALQRAGTDGGEPGAGDGGAAGRGGDQHSGRQGSQRQAAADCRTGALPAARLQDLLGRRQPGAGGHRRRRARADQRGRRTRRRRKWAA